MASAWVYLLVLGVPAQTGPKHPDIEVAACLAAYEANRKACAPIAAWYCLGARGHGVSRADLSEQFVLGEHGVPVAQLLDVLRRYEPQACALQGRAEHLDLLPMPAILIIRSHCVVLVDLDRQREAARIFDPADGRVREVEAEVLQANWSGMALVFAKPRLSLLEWLATAACSAIAVVLPGHWIFLRASRCVP